MVTKLHFGNILTPTFTGDIDFLPNSALCEQDGKIVFIGTEKESKSRYSNQQIVDHKNSIIMPGMIDLHTHLPQYDAVGIGQGTLLEWLQKYIFPTEEKFSNLVYARYIASKFFKDLLTNGTTTAVVFGPVQKEATDIAFKEAEKSGIRLFMGKTMMDIGDSDLVTNTKQNIDDSLSIAEKWHDTNNHLLNYIMLPRYAGSCSLELMIKSAEISRINNLMIQTHIAENEEELKYILKLHPKYESYLDIYKFAGMVGENGQFVHCIYLTIREKKLIKDSGSSIIHCPVSNRYLQSGVMPLIQYLNQNIPIGLGTDIAGGYSLSILNEAREAIESTKTFNIINNTQEQILTPVKAFKLTNIDAAKILKISHETGSLEIGKSADMIVVDTKDTLDNLQKQSSSSIIEKIIYKYQDMKIENVYVKGKLISPLP